MVGLDGNGEMALEHNGELDGSKLGVNLQDGSTER
jgi:hypothetical protein